MEYRPQRASVPPHRSANRDGWRKAASRSWDSAAPSPDQPDRPQQAGLEILKRTCVDQLHFLDRVPQFETGDAGVLVHLEDAIDHIRRVESFRLQRLRIGQYPPR